MFNKLEIFAMIFLLLSVIFGIFAIIRHNDILAYVGLGAALISGIMGYIDSRL